MKVTSKKWLALGILTVALAAVPALAFTLNGDGPRSPHQYPVRSGDPSPGYGGASKPIDPLVAPDRKMVKELAPIDGVAFRAAESYPPQYFARVEFGLPNGCVEPGGYEVARSGNDIRIAVSVLRPAGDDVICTMVYGTGTYDVPLGSDFVSGETYTVGVNETTKTFTAQ